MSSSWKTCLAQVLNVLPRNIGHFYNEIDLVGSEGLEGMKVHIFKPQKTFSTSLLVTV